MKARALLLGFALIFATGSAAFAQDDEEDEVWGGDATLVGWYVGLTGIGTFENFSSSVNSDNGGGAGITLGHRASDVLSFEVEMDFLGGLHTPAKGFANTKSDIEMWTAMLNFRMHFPIEESPIEPYMTYGVGAMDVQTGDKTGQNLGRINHTDIALKAGAGVSYQHTDALSFFVAGTYVLPLGNLKRFDHGGLNVGFLYKWADDEY